MWCVVCVETVFKSPGLRGGLEHLKIETRLRVERVESVTGECDLETISVSSILSLILSGGALSRIISTLDLICEENVTRR